MEATGAPRRLATTRDFFVVMVVIVYEAISAGMLFPYIGILVMDLSPGMREADSGMVSGLVAGSFQLAQALFGSAWGKQSDRYGRRPVILFGIISSVVCCICFGFSSSVLELFVFRFLAGAMNCTSAISKAVIAESVDSSNEGRGWALLAVAWAVGGMIGPVVGGLLYDPARHLSSRLFADTVFDTYPALLSTVATATYGLFAFVYAFFDLRESNLNARQPEWLAVCANCSLRHRRHVQLGTAEDACPAEGDVELEAPPSVVVATVTEESHYGLADMLRDEAMATCLFIYISASWVGTTFQEVFPLLAILPVDEGGLGVHASQIGLIFMAMACESVVTNFYYPTLLRLVSRVRLLQWTCVIWAVGLAFTPLVTAVRWESTLTVVLACAAWLVLRSFASVIVFSIVMAGMGALAPRRHLGQATAISHSCGNLFRSFLPPFFTVVFSWSVGGSSSAVALKKSANRTSTARWVGNRTTAPRDWAFSVAPTIAPRRHHQEDTFIEHLLGHGFPMNKWLVFFIMGIGIGVCYFLALRLRDDQIVRPDEPKADAAADPKTETAMDDDSDVDSLDAFNDPNPAVKERATLVNGSVLVDDADAG